MIRKLLHLCLSLGALAGLLFPAAAEAQVLDRANLVKPETVARANERIQKLMDKTGIGLVFEIREKMPKELATALEGKKVPAQRELIDAWITQRIQELKLDEGLYVLLSLEPARIEMRVWPRNNTRLFDEWYQRELRRRIVARILPDFPDQKPLQKLKNAIRGAVDPDKGLLDVVDYGCAKLAYNRPIDQTVWYWSIGVIGFVFTGWVVLDILRTRLRKRTPREAGVFDEEESGRSIAVLGGGIGAVTSRWLLGWLSGRNREPEPTRRSMEPVVPALHPRIAEKEMQPQDSEKNEEPATPEAV